MNRILAVLIIFLIVTISKSEYSCDTTIVRTDTIVACSTRTSDGFLLSVEYFKNGKRDGELLEWHRNGQIKYKEHFRNGCPLDTSYEYFSNGNVKRITPYKGCEQHGLFVLLSKPGDTLAKGMTSNGKSVGAHYAWWENGNLKFKINYNDSGKKHGLSETWREDGTRKDSTVYVNGDIVEVCRYYNNGKLRYHKKQKPVNRNINAVYYDPQGKKCGEVKNGTGTYISYSDDGTSARRVYFENDDVVKSEEVEVK